MKTKYLLFGLLAALVCACNDSNDSNSASYTETKLSEAPEWQIDWTNNQERPNWTEQDFSSIYENWTILKVQIEDELQPYVSDGDMMALFINGELRGLASPAVIAGGGESSNIKYLLKVWGNESGSETVNMSLRYYNQTLKHIFTLSDNISLDSDEIIGIDEDYIPAFTMGSAKYPMVKMVSAESLLTKAGITPFVGNIVGAFVGNECRGTAVISSPGSTLLILYGRTDGESVTLKYYDVERGVLYTLADPVKL